MEISFTSINCEKFVSVKKLEFFVVSVNPFFIIIILLVHSKDLSCSEIIKISSGCLFLSLSPLFMVPVTRITQYQFVL